MAINGSFLQSYQWGEFQKSLGRKIWRVETDELKTLVIRHNLPLKKNYLYCPRGLITQQFLEEVKKIAKQENSIFFKIEPAKDISLSQLRPSAKQIQPSQTIILDISQSEEELLEKMHQKTRYNIRLAQRKGAIVQQSINKKRVDIFLSLLTKTAKRDKFSPHPKEYYQKMLEVLGPEGMVKLFLAEYKDQIIAVNLVYFFGQTATYLHGAADYNFRQIMAPHLLQWQAILEAKELGMKYYDFWGIDQEKWPGVTRFKKGFAGQQVTHPGAFDLIFQPLWYFAYNLARRIL